MGNGFLSFKVIRCGTGDDSNSKYQGVWSSGQDVLVAKSVVAVLLLNAPTDVWVPTRQVCSMRRSQVRFDS